MRILLELRNKKVFIAVFITVVIAFLLIFCNISEQNINTKRGKLQKDFAISVPTSLQNVISNIASQGKCDGVDRVSDDVIMISTYFSDTELTNDNSCHEINGFNANEIYGKVFKKNCVYSFINTTTCKVLNQIEIDYVLGDAKVQSYGKYNVFYIDNKAFVLDDGFNIIDKISTDAKKNAAYLNYYIDDEGNISEGGSVKVNFIVIPEEKKVAYLYPGSKNGNGTIESMELRISGYDFNEYEVICRGCSCDVENMFLSRDMTKIYYTMYSGEFGVIDLNTRENKLSDKFFFYKNEGEQILLDKKQNNLNNVDLSKYISWYCDEISEEIINNNYISINGDYLYFPLFEENSSIDSISDFVYLGYNYRTCEIEHWFTSNELLEDLVVCEDNSLMIYRDGDRVKMRYLD